MPPEEKKERIPIKSLRTYQGDVEEAIANNKWGYLYKNNVEGQY